MPAIKPGDTVQLAAQNPITAMQKLSNAPIDLNPKHTDALRKLTEIFNEAACVDDENTENNPAPRVKQPLTRVQPSSSHDPTSPKVLTVQPRIHQRITRSNTPMPTIHEETPRLSNASEHLIIKPGTTSNKPAPTPINCSVPTTMRNNYPGHTNNWSHYISQDDDEELANLLVNVAVPQINELIEINPVDEEPHQANLLHAKLYRDSLPKTQLHS
jgi:hypothetical protein